MPKLLLLGIVEKTCMKTVIREIPGITDCFNNQEDKDTSGKAEDDPTIPDKGRKT